MSKHKKALNHNPVEGLISYHQLLIQLSLALNFQFIVKVINNWFTSCQFMMSSSEMFSMDLDSVP